MLCSLSALSHLESLEFEGTIPDLTQLSSQFPQLRLLHGQATHPTLLRIGLLMPLLVHLDLELPPRSVAEPPTLVIDPLRSLIKLESVTLRVQGDAPLESKDLETLAKFRNLRRLYIGNPSLYQNKVSAPDFTDKTLCSILQCLPLLESLELRLRHPSESGGQALLTLAKHCPNLRMVYIPGHYDLAPFLSSTQLPAYPDLGTLCIASLFFRHPPPNRQFIPRTEFRMMFDVLAQHFPKLSHIRFDDRHWHIGIRLNSVLGKSSDAQCGCDQYGAGEEHKHIDHMLRDDHEHHEESGHSVP